MEEKKGFVFYRSFYEAISKVSSKELKADIFEAICELGLNNNVVNLTDNISQIIIDLISPQIVANNCRYEQGLSNGVFGGRPNKYDDKKIIVLLENGLSNKEIAEEIGCSISSVKYYRQKLDKKSKTVKNTKEKEKEKEKDKVKDKDIFISTTTTNKNNNVFVLVEKEFGRTLSSTEIEKIIELENDYGTDKLKLAIKECCLNNVKKIAYLNGILKNWKDKTLDEIKNEKLSETQPKSSVSQQEIEISEYDWVNDDED